MGIDKKSHKINLRISHDDNKAVKSRLQTVIAPVGKSKIREQSRPIR